MTDDDRMVEYLAADANRAWFVATYGPPPPEMFVWAGRALELFWQLLADVIVDPATLGPLVGGATRIVFDGKGFHLEPAPPGGPVGDG